MKQQYKKSKKVINHNIFEFLKYVQETEQV